MAIDERLQLVLVNQIPVGRIAGRRRGAAAVIVPPPYQLALSAVLFTLGMVGVLVRRSALIVFMSIELMLNAVNLALIIFARLRGSEDAQVLVFFVLVVAAVACGIVGAAFLAALLLSWQLGLRSPADRRVVMDLYPWIAAGSVQVPLRLLVDPLSTAMVLMVSGVGFLIHIYSAGYMGEESPSAYARYFAYLNLFMAAMLWLVLSANLVTMFIGWEGVGLCSYLLIAFWFTRPAAALAGVKAMLVTRLGDVGFLLGIFLAIGLFGTTDFVAMAEQSPQRLPLGGAAATALALLLFAGATGKSAQLPLYVWLPDAMEGPTPVSALIHAATMVTAGVYMIGRLSAVYLRAPAALELVAAVGALTAIFGAACALVEWDLKRVLAYSTISQLGYMFLAMGIGAFGAGIFHLISHAFFKALLFLAAGGVMHALAGETDMRRMGGLERHLPRTAAAFAIGALALAGIPPLSGFFSKDQILSQAFHARTWLWMVGLAASGFTGFYILRAFALTFLGLPAAGTGSQAHDPPRSMEGPMGMLAGLAVIGGALGWSFTHPGVLAEYLAPHRSRPGRPACPSALPSNGVDRVPGSPSPQRVGRER